MPRWGLEATGWTPQGETSERAADDRGKHDSKKGGTQLMYSTRKLSPKSLAQRAEDMAWVLVLTSLGLGALLGIGIAGLCGWGRP